MEIRVRSTGAVMYADEFRQLNFKDSIPYDLTPEVLNDYGADVVFEGPQATGGDVYQFSMRQGVEQKEDGKWYTKYVLGPIFTDQPAVGDIPAKTAAQQMAEYKALKDAEKATSIRAQRDQMLKDSDWTQLADSPVDKAVWATYRQALRDVTSQEGFPWTITWPVAPDAVAPAAV